MSSRVAQTLHIFIVVILAGCPVKATPMLYDIYLETPSPYRQPFEIDEILWKNSGLWSSVFPFTSEFVSMKWAAGLWEQGGSMNLNIHELLKP